MGALKLLHTDPPHPLEDHEDGCPGAWYRCNFVLSLHKYERLQTDAGFSENLLLTSRSDDRLLLEAITYYERERMRARARDQEVLHKDT